VADVREIVSGLCPNPLGGGVRGHQAGKSLLQVSQTTIKKVVFAVGNLRPGLHIVEVVVSLDRPPKSLSLGFGLSSAQSLRWSIEVQFFLGQRRLPGTSGITDLTLNGNLVE
jgi:hypothetical protein